jgi:predicted HicB family RNase H-like nuclease
MSKNTKGRFDYLPKAEQNKVTKDTDPSSSDTISGELRSVPRGEGRMEQERDQLNVRVPTTLKRQAVAKAALEGKSIGEVVEALLFAYIKGSTQS